MTTDNRVRALLTVDLEDYRRQTLRDEVGGSQPAYPREVERQLETLLAAFGELRASATFFTVGRLTRELRPSLWANIVSQHELGCHGDEHHRVYSLGPRRFRDDLRNAKRALEDRAGVNVRSFRAPYFSSDGCDPWFGEELAAAGFDFDSSRRFNSPPHAFDGTVGLVGSAGRVREVPMPSVGFGRKRITVIGGTYFRLFPLTVCRRLLARAQHDGFIPMVYLHPYDVDPDALPIAYPAGRYWAARAGDKLRRVGRVGALAKLRELARYYNFVSLSSLRSAD